MATRAPEAPNKLGLAATYYAASAGGDKVPPGVTLHVKNANAATRTLTFVTPGVIDGSEAIADAVSNAIPATNGERFFQVPTDRNFVNPADGLVDLTWSSDVGVTFAVLS